MARFVTLFFLVVLVGTLTVDTLWPAPMPELIGRERADYEIQVREAKWSDGSRVRLLEQDLRLTSRVRRTVGPPIAFWLYRNAGVVKPVALLGKDGWLFHSGRAQSRFTRPNAPVQAAMAMAALQRAVAFEGVSTLAMPIPRKSVVEDVHLPPGFDARPELDERLIAEFRRRGVDAVNLLGVYRNDQRFLAEQGEPRQDLYAMTDTHWSPRAEYLAARAVARRSGRIKPPAERLGRLISFEPGPMGRDMIAYSGMELTPAVVEFLEQHRVQGWRVVDAEGEPLMIPRAPARAPVAVLGTSFIARRNFANFLGHFIGEPVHNGGKLGGDTAQEFGRLLEAGHRPELAVLEVPNHAFFAPRILRGVGVGLGVIDYGPDLPVVLGAEHFRVLELTGALGVVNARPLLFGYDPPLERVGSQTLSTLVHSGDGVLGWRVRGEVVGSGVNLDAGAGAYTPRIPWREGDPEVVIPIVSPASTADLVDASRLLGHLRISTPPVGGKASRARVDSVELVALARTDSMIELEPGTLGPDDGEFWSQELLVPDGPIGANALLDLELDLVGPHAPVVLFEVVSKDARTPLYRAQAGGLARRARVLLNLAAFAHQELESIRVRGRRGPPTSVIGRARLYSVEP